MFLVSKNVHRHAQANNSEQQRCALTENGYCWRLPSQEALAGALQTVADHARGMAEQTQRIDELVSRHNGADATQAAVVSLRAPSSLRQPAVISEKKDEKEDDGTEATASKAQMNTSHPLFKMALKSGFDMWFAPNTDRCRGPQPKHVSNQH